MFKKLMNFSILAVLFGFLAACAGSPFYHDNIMRGQVVGIDEDEVVVCIGSEDGVKEGQDLQVYRYVWEGAVEDGDDDYRVDPVGTLQIKSVVNEHFSRAIRTKGLIEKHDIVELRMRSTE